MHQLPTMSDGKRVFCQTMNAKLHTTLKSHDVIWSIKFWQFQLSESEPFLSFSRFYKDLAELDILTKRPNFFISVIHNETY